MLSNDQELFSVTFSTHTRTPLFKTPNIFIGEHGSPFSTLLSLVAKALSVWHDKQRETYVYPSKWRMSAPSPRPSLPRAINQRPRLSLSYIFYPIFGQHPYLWSKAVTCQWPASPWSKSLQFNRWNWADSSSFFDSFANTYLFTNPT